MKKNVRLHQNNGLAALEVAKALGSFLDAHIDKFDDVPPEITAFQGNLQKKTMKAAVDAVKENFNKAWQDALHAIAPEVLPATLANSSTEAMQTREAHVASVKEKAGYCKAHMFMPDERKAIAEAFEWVVEAMKETFPMPLPEALLIESIRCLVPINAATRCCHIATALGTASKVVDAMKIWSMLGSRDAERYDNDASHEKITNLTVAKGVLHSCSQDTSLSTQDLGTNANNALQVADHAVTRCGKQAIAEEEALVEKTLREIKDWAKGGANGKRWDEKAKSSHSLATVVELAKDSLSKLKYDDMTKALEQVSGLRDILKATAGKYGVSMNPKVSGSLDGLVQSLAMISIEYLIVACHMSGRPDGEKRTKTEAAQAKFLKYEGAWNDANEQLQARATQMLAGM